jgi:UDP-4-amino-4,6-dideoxy-N-acetyl-beta-L-altrosamine transaminase
MNKPIPYGRQYISAEDIEAVTQALTSDLLTQGPQLPAFEKAFAEYIGVKYAVAVANGTAALHLCALALDVNERTRVITTPITFAASANCIRYCNGQVDFADIDPETFLVNLDHVRSMLASHPKGTFQGLIPVDFAGYPVNLEECRKIADEYGLWIIEDACHAPGGYFTDSHGVKQNCGNGKYAELAIFSFHPVKHIACGEGGMITTNDESLYKKLLLLRTHGITKDASLLHENHGGWYYEMQTLGYNYRLTDFQAALGISQLKRAGEGLKKRIAIAAEYFDAFKSQPGILRQSGVVEGHAYHLYIIQVSDRKGLYDFLRTRNIFCQVHYIPVHTLPYYRQLNGKSELPMAEQYYDHCLSIPMYPTLMPEERDYVIASILEFINE